MTKETIADIALKGVQTLSECPLELKNSKELQSALRDTVTSQRYQSHTQHAEQLFKNLTSDNLQQNKLASFLNGWKTVHITALYVSGLIIRIQKEAQEATRSGEDYKAALLHQAACHVGDIIMEDTGLVGKQHGELFERFANTLCDNDDWKLDRFSVKQCNEFRAFIEHGRLKRPVEDAILITAASENWNTGEYTYAKDIVMDWLMTKKNMDLQKATRTAAYVNVHAGDTELGHFTHALKAWQLYCEAQGIDASPEKAKTIFQEYSEQAGTAYNALKNTISSPVIDQKLSQQYHLQQLS